jgi:hypothetical protein
MMHDIDQLNSMTAADLAALLSDDGSQTAILRAAAEGGAVDAQLLLGQRLLDQAGDADGANATDAVLWFSRAATAGHPMGMNMLGRCLHHGWGTAVDKRQAAAWYEAAAGRRLAWGMYNLATLLTLGDGVPRDRARALDLFRRAAALGHAKSMNMVGSFHEDGWVVPVDLLAASLWYKRAAEGGDFRGQFNHARMLVSAGRIDAGIGWLGRLPRTAPPRFLDQVRAWLDASDVPALRALALDAHPETRYASASQ